MRSASRTRSARTTRAAGQPPGCASRSRNSNTIPAAHEAKSEATTSPARGAATWAWLVTVSGRRPPYVCEPCDQRTGRCAGPGRAATRLLVRERLRAPAPGAGSGCVGGDRHRRESGTGCGPRRRRRGNPARVSGCTGAVFATPRSANKARGRDPATKRRSALHPRTDRLVARPSQR